MDKRRVLPHEHIPKRIRREIVALNKEHIQFYKAALERNHIHFTNEELRIYLKIWQEQRSARVWREHSDIDKLLQHYQEFKNQFVASGKVELRRFMFIYFDYPIRARVRKEFSFPIQREGFKPVISAEQYPWVLKPINYRGIKLNPGDLFVGFHLGNIDKTKLFTMAKTMLSAYEEAKQKAREYYPNIHTLFVHSALLDPARMLKLIKQQTNLTHIPSELLFQNQYEIELAAHVYRLVFPGLTGKRLGKERLLYPGFYAEAI